MLLVLALVVRVMSDAPIPELSECFTVNGRDYRGSVNYAGPERIPCLYWNQTTQHRYNSLSDPSGKLGLGNHNYCRNPDSDVQPWCYVSEMEEGSYWKYCDIPACHMPGYVGCFLDFGSPPALSGASGTSAKLTIQTCIRYCRGEGYQYAGVEAGYACFCGSPSDVDALQMVSSSQCDQVCFGRTNQLCGGDGKLSVYSVWVGACHYNLSSTFGVLYSPDFPDEYSGGSTCSWDVRSPGSTAIEMQFRSFSVLDPNDVLEVRDGQSGSLLIQIQGGQDPPQIVIFTTGHLRITFQSDTVHNGQEYAIIYKGLGQSLSSSVSVVPNYRTLSSPNYMSPDVMDHTEDSAQSNTDHPTSKNGTPHAVGGLTFWDL
ncbi:kremen protein 2 isoform X2 [Mixophyes fleayi]|uniref:kremen protein 2 isoform X2 n=1 Tax=Mixophyes fleayi TaxID=3061075 RepID=UPI003F4E1D48